VSRTGATIIGLFVVFILPGFASADWKVYYTGKAASMFGSYGRGNFATRSQCDAYQMTRPAFERNNSYCSGFDTASPSPVKKSQQPDQTKAAPAQGQATKQPQQGQAGAQENRFAGDKESLLRTIKLPPPDDGLRPSGTSFFNSGGGNASPEVRTEQEDFDRMNARWVARQRQLIDQRLREPNPYAAEICRSLKIKVPPLLPSRKFDELKPGDVLLISREDITDASFWINLGDRFTTDPRSPASHTVLFLKEVNGKKLFLDHTPGRGSHVIDEDEFLRTYGHRDALVASPRIAVAQPVRESETARIWEAAKRLARKEADIQEEKRGYIVDQTGYGVYGNENMVCSEASRWVLVRSGRDIPESASPLKRLLGIHYGPANFFSDDYNFIITPLWGNQ
jgi:hypothetical protein